MWAVQMAFREYSPYLGMGNWVGFEYFVKFFRSPDFFKLLKNTLSISLLSLAVNFPLPIILALMLNELRALRFKKVVQTITYIPYFISIVVVVGIAVNFLSPSTGVINHVLAKLGFEKTYFMIKPEWFRTVYIAMGTWKDTGFSSIVFIAALAAVDQQLYEACYIDGGGRLRQLWHITLPGILPTIIIMLILRVGSILNVGYEAIILMYQPATYDVADVINTYVYRWGLATTIPQYGLTTAVGLFNSVVSLVLVAASNAMSKKLTDIKLW
jgi:putative aldouronate transport system permease protein